MRSPQVIDILRTLQEQQHKNRVAESETVKVKQEPSPTHEAGPGAGAAPHLTLQLGEKSVKLESNASDADQLDATKHVVVKEETGDWQGQGLSIDHMDTTDVAVDLSSSRT